MSWDFALAYRLVWDPSCGLCLVRKGIVTVLIRHASSETGECTLGMRRIAACMNTDPRTVSRHVPQLPSDPAMPFRVEITPGVGITDANHYRLVLPVVSASVDPVSTPVGASVDPLSAQCGSSVAASVDPLSSQRGSTIHKTTSELPSELPERTTERARTASAALPSQPPLVLKAEEPASPKAKTSKPRKAPATACPADFAASEGNYALGERLGFDRARVDAECEAMRDYHASKGNTFASWNATLNTWLRNSQKYEQRDRATSRPARVDNRQPLAEGQQFRNFDPEQGA